MKPLGTRVAFVGLGYVGLSTAVCFASRGFTVRGIDVDEARIKAISRGAPPTHEEGLEPLLRSAVKSRALSFGSDYEGVGQSKIVFLTVGTPSREDGSIDITYLEAAVKEVGRQLSSIRGYRVVVVKSTVVPGTTEGVIRHIIERESGKKVGREIGLASNPEFLHQGAAIEETLRPDAVVIGGVDGRSSDALLKVYTTFYKKPPTTILMAPANAEMVRYAINVGSAVQLGFVNTVADLCTRTPGCDYDDVRKGFSTIARMDQRYLGAGLGFGGSCLPKDTRALVSSLKKAGINDELVSSALKVNDGQVDEALRLAEGLCGSLEGRRVALLGLAFQANRDDIRESVAISLAKTLIKLGAEVTVYDPVAMESVRKLLGSQLTYAKSAKDCIRGSECAFIATGWDQFKQLKPRDFLSLMATPAIVDGRRIYDHARFLKAGVRIATIGTGRSFEGRVEKSRSSPKKDQKWHYTFVSHPGPRE